VTLKLVARFADACNIGGEPDTIRHKLAVLQQHCDTLGRNYDAIIKSSNMNVFPLQPGQSPEQATERARTRLGMTYEEMTRAAVVGTPEQIAEQIQARVDVGVNYIIVYIPMLAYDLDPMHLFAEEVATKFA
jgi:alkanesulfonate monooxygenase SsuD/methylene tetrahydromethanopterin reductase-like flavin-dependent oxidoreductase (luciferase family)